MLEYRDIKDLLARVKYKPNVYFDVSQDHSFDGNLKVHAKMWTLDSRQEYPPPERWTALTINGVGVRDIMWLGDNHNRMTCNIDPIRIASTQIVPWSVREAGERLFWTWFKRAIIDELEHHEIDEWFRVDGELVHDPHKNDWSRA